MGQLRKEFSVYFIVGGVATLMDWSVYGLSLWVLGDKRYLLSVVLSMGIAGTFHYLANKHFTFQCHSKAVMMQVPVYVAVAVAGLFMSMGILHFLVAVIAIKPMWARVLTTMLMLLPNYLMHKYLTFSKKIFKRT